MTAAIVARLGVPVLAVRCTDAAIDDDFDAFDAGVSSWEIVAITAILSSPSDQESRDLAGRNIRASRRATIAGTTDLKADREGRADLIVEIPGATSLVVAGSTVSINGAPAKAIAITDEAIRIADTDIRVWRIADVKDDRHPITRVRKFSVFLQEVGGV